IGIVAARLVQQLGKPVVLIATEGGVARGSGRSVPGFDLAQAIGRARELLTSCGGHAAAAGLEMDGRNVPALAEQLCDIAREQIADPPPSTLEIDSEVMLHQIDRRLLDELRTIGPFGAGNPLPLFAASGVEMTSAPRRVGQEGAHLLLKLRGGGAPLSAIA